MDLDVVYFAMPAAFVTHEFDAVARHEWRILPFLRWLPDRIGAQVFVWGHAPLMFGILWFSRNDGCYEGFRRGLAAFAVIHVGLHWLLRKHPANEFNAFGSWCLILLTGLLGAAYLAGPVL